MRKTILLLFPVLLASCHQGTSQNGASGSDALMVLAGTYTGTGSWGIYALRMDPRSGAMVPVDSIRQENPSFLALDPERGYLYSVRENGDSTAALVSLRLDKATGAFLETGTAPTLGAHPCHVTVTQKAAYVSNYSGGSLSVFRLTPEGVATGPVLQIPGTAKGADSRRQATPHVHCSVVEPDGAHLLFSDFSADRVVRLDLDGEGLPIAGTESSAVLTPATGPRHIILSPDGRLAYVIGELSEAVSVIRLEDMRVLQEVQAHPKAGRQAGDIHLSPDGRHLYASIRHTDDGIAVFDVDPSTGLLERTGYQSTGIHPRNFAITPDGRLLLAACRDSDKIECYLIDPMTGQLDRLEGGISLPHPVFVLPLEP